MIYKSVPKELFDEIGRSLNITCGSSCTYPMLGVGALLAYSLLPGNQLSRMGQDLAARTGLDHFGERMSSVQTEGIFG